MSSTFVLQEVIDDLVNSKNTLVDPLAKLNYFRLIKNEELIHFTGNELNGYKKSEEIPEYRKFVAQLMVDMQAHIHKHTYPVPVEMLEEPFRSALKYLTVNEGIGTVEKFVKDFERTEKNQGVIHKLPMQMLSYIEPAALKLYSTDARIDVVGARQFAPSYIMIEVVNSVRTKLLDLVMRVGEEFGFNIEIDSFKKNQDANNKIINNYMKTEITNTGDGNVINTGAEATVTATITIQKGDTEQLKKALQQYGIEEGDVDEISEIIKEEKPDVENKRLGKKANEWIGKIVSKSLSGIGKISTSLTANILATMIKAHYGIGL